MKTKIFDALKQTFAGKYGVGDEVLRGYADSLAATGLVTEENLQTVIQGQENALRAYQVSFDKVRGEKTAIQKELDELKAQANTGGEPAPNPQPKQDGDDDFDAKMQKWYEKNIQPIKTELDTYKTREAASARTNTITAKAKELGIPAWRIEEGFNIAEDADETAISATLAKVAQNVKTAGLGNQTGFPISTSSDQAKERATKWAEGLPDKSN